MNKPCPFCGQSPCKLNYWPGCLCCENCGIQLPEGYWNDRPQDDKLRDAVLEIANMAAANLKIFKSCPSYRQYHLSYANLRIAAKQAAKALK